MYGSSAEFPMAGSLFGRDNCRGLADKSFDKRKAAAQALQQLIKQMVATAAAAEPSSETDSEETEAATTATATATATAAGGGEGVEAQQSVEQLSGSLGLTRGRQHQQELIKAAVEKAVAALTADFLTSPIPNIRKGGLLGVAAVGLAFEGEGIEFCLPLLLRPLLKSFNDPDPRVRYYACESLFNVLKVVKGQCLPFLSELFDGLCKLCSDVDKEVRQGFSFVDALLKEEAASAAATAAALAATGSPAVSPITPAFVQLLAERLLVRNPYIKLLTLSWISLLESNAGIDVLPYLPLFLEGLLQLLGDSHRDIRQAADLCVTHFLEDLRSDPVEMHPAVVAQIAEVVLRCSDGSNSSFTQLTSLVWLHELLLLLLPDEGQQQQQHQQQRQISQGVKRVGILENNNAPSPDVAIWHQEVQKHLKPLAWRMLQSILRCSSEGEDEIARMATEVHAHVIARVMVSTAALDLSGFVKSAVRYLRTYTPPELGAPTSAATAAVAGNSVAGSADVRPLCLQWMELMLVEKPHLLLQHDEQQQPQEQQQQQQEQQQGGSQQVERQQEECLKDEESRQEEQHLEDSPEKERQQGSQQEDKIDDLLLEQQKPLVSAVLYTALTAAGPADLATSQDGGASTPRSTQEQPSRQQSAATPRGRAAAAASAATAASANQILRMALSLLTRFTQLSKAKLNLVTEELLLLFSANRRFLDSRGHYVLRQICTMGDPCEVYVHFGAQIERHHAAAFAAKEAAEVLPPPISTFSTLRTTGVLRNLSLGGPPRQTSIQGGTLEDKFVPRAGSLAGGSLGQTLQFLHQLVQALSIALLSAKETKAIREELRKGNKDLFEALLPSWANNCVALLALSLFAEEFQLAKELVILLSKEDSLQTADLLQLEQLALLFETQVFAFIRVRLLHQPPDQHLITAIRGVAMLLPQGPAFAMLNQRLQLASGCCCSTSCARSEEGQESDFLSPLTLRALTLAKTAREQLEAELPLLDVCDDSSSNGTDSRQQSTTMQVSMVSSLKQLSTENPPNLECLESLDEALTEHGSTLKAFPSVCSNY